MKIEPTSLKGVYVIDNNKFEDHRGSFIKNFHFDTFKAAGLETDFKESFYSVSKKNVLRGMHFQLPPHDHVKLVYVVSGEILDVVVDVRESSPTFGKFFDVKLSSDNAKSIYIGKGFAHGFLTLSDQATVVYLISTIHNEQADTGIRWDSFGFDWGAEDIVMSERDCKFSVL